LPGDISPPGRWLMRGYVTAAHGPGRACRFPPQQFQCDADRPLLSSTKSLTGFLWLLSPLYPNSLFIHPRTQVSHLQLSGGLVCKLLCTAMFSLQFQFSCVIYTRITSRNECVFAAVCLFLFILTGLIFTNFVLRVEE